MGFYRRFGADSKPAEAAPLSIGKTGTTANLVWLAVAEVLSTGGSPSTRFSRLERRWTFSVGAGTVMQLDVEGFKSNSTDGDDFRFEYSTDGTSFTPLSPRSR